MSVRGIRGGECLRDLTDLVQETKNNGGFAMNHGDHVPSAETGDG